MSTWERIYLGYKYYYRAIVMPETEAGQTYYAGITTEMFTVPADMEVDSELTLASGGDLMPYAPVCKNICPDMWNEAGDYFFNADIVTANLETPIDLSKPASYVPEVMLNDMYFNGDRDMFEIFSGNGLYSGYDILSVANNHSLDQGEAGLLATLDFLDAQHVKYAGAARNASKTGPVLIEKNGLKLAFIAATFSLNAEVLPKGKEHLVNLVDLNDPDADLSLLLAQAAEARAMQADLLVFMLHMGCAYQAYPAATVRRNIHRLVKATGADLILGNHAHHPQPVEVLSVIDPASGTDKQALIIYAHGDFIAYDIYKWCHLPMLARIRISKGRRNGKVFSCITGVDFKLFYMYADIREGRVTSLQLYDYEKLKANIPAHFNAETRSELNELNALAALL